MPSSLFTMSAREVGSGHFTCSQIHKLKTSKTSLIEIVNKCLFLIYRIVENVSRPREQTFQRGLDTLVSNIQYLKNKINNPNTHLLNLGF